MRRTMVAAVAVMLLATSAAPAAQGERFLANATSMGNVSGTSRIECNVERWTTDEERNRFLQILAEGGQAALVPELQKVEVGRVRVGTRNSYPISYAYERQGEDGYRQIIIATDRPIGALEAVGRARTMDYAIAIAELRIPGDGNGEGALIVGGAVVADAETHTLSLENYGQTPVRLRNVRAQ